MLLTAVDPTPLKSDAIAKKSMTSRVEASIETAGDKWFNLPATELTPELKADLFLIKSRHLLDPKRHYRKDNKSNEVPKFFQVYFFLQTGMEWPPMIFFFH
jgi:hypothetical protein